MTGAAMAKARKSWGTTMPDWVRELAEQCDRSSQARVADILGNSTTVVSRVLSNSYPGSVERIAAKVRGHFLAEVVDCPVLETIPRQRCVAEQDMALSFQNPLRRRVYEACRAGCTHFRKVGK